MGKDAVKDSSYIIDKFLVKGISHNRDENDLNYDYLYVDQ